MLVIPVAGSVVVFTNSKIKLTWQEVSGVKVGMYRESEVMKYGYSL